MFEGVYTAIVTPFDEEGKLDDFRFRELLQFQVENGVDGIVPVGTTGESPTLEPDEHLEVIRLAVEVCRDRVKVIAGTGANATREALQLTAAARDLGADGTLQVTPYYNKPSDAGLIKHFQAVADLGLPTILYNVPGRTGREIPVGVVAELAQHDAVVAVKEAGGRVDRVSAIRGACDIEVLSGDDPLTLPMMSVGATEVISVASNIIPRVVSDMVRHALGGRWDAAEEIHHDYYALFNAMFMETNPLPVKTALAMMGRIEERFRLPLCPMPDTLRTQLEEQLREYRLI